jgi:serine/threonine protein kinase
MSSKYDFSAEGYWKKGKVIGTGGSSTVYQATIQHNNEIIASKEILIDGLSKDQVLAIEAEVNTIKSLEHKHIVNYLGTQLKGHHFYIFLEYADRGSLRQYYRKHGRIPEDQVACCTKQLLLGLLYLHGNDIAHRDIKGANVLLTNAGEMKLADFGASKRYDTASIVSGLKGKITMLPLNNSTPLTHII